MKKPSEIKAIKAKMAYFLPSSFRAITLFGTAYCNEKRDVELINNSGDEIDSVLKCHETIHVRQAEEARDSWFIYYLNYVWQWICNLPLILYGWNMPYKFIPYELEAYANEDNFYYTCNVAEQWREFKKIPFKQKRKYVKEYKKSLYRFKDFVTNVMLPNMNEEK